ncbi:uncharacterized protein BDZ99DRAFT_24790 [Mytilinidion resinicola]|uniref:DUF7730 domain-containing protein n=1 Tax=Mytilinidion resinicola TaxID=574789 RepID=A0A6A6ZAQ5_9PEZI|nr:uncharacterized protein BDZ99DRAFT_24790 [Mytilinidion resinicola]KAF2817918.1 hypothetical protein BDZ99DRAFT_24790 [Mytilinidion resinicola]
MGGRNVLRSAGAAICNAAGFCVGACIVILVLGFIAVRDSLERRKRKKQHCDRFQKRCEELAIVPPLLQPRPPRKRRLTSPLVDEAAGDQQTDAQSDSIFFCSLSLELRIIVYEMVLTGRIFHVEIENEDLDPRMSAFECRKLRNPVSHSHPCWTHDHEAKESIKILYSNTFDFRDRREFLKIPRVLIPARFNAIRSLKLAYCMDADRTFGGQWDFPFPLWEVLASMEGLRFVHVTFFISISHKAYWLRFQDHYLQPLRDAGIRAYVTLVMPFPDCPPANMDTSNFKIVIPKSSMVGFGGLKTPLLGSFI